jgi:hypothetical protein
LRVQIEYFERLSKNTDLVEDSASTHIGDDILLGKRKGEPSYQAGKGVKFGNDCEVHSTKSSSGLEIEEKKEEVKKRGAKKPKNAKCKNNRQKLGLLKQQKNKLRITDRIKTNFKKKIKATSQSLKKKGT